MRRLTLSILFIFFVIGSLLAKEGMWIPLLLEKYNLAEMQEMGFKLSAQDIYDVNNASMKDAVAVFGRGCTSEMISPEGLLITNHHCGYRQIQSHSTVENDYLTNGFWAMSRDEELPNPGLTVRFLEYMKDVTEEVLEGTEGLSANEAAKKIKTNSQKIENEASENGKLMTRVKPLFYGNQYFLYVYKVFKDVRLVGAPPSAIGKFGGDTDNWMWPRHTGDFSLFRVYADENNEPAEYSPDNVPYQPQKYFPISLGGVQPEDFTMVFGNPGSTMQYIPSHEVDIIMNQRDPDRIAIRDKKLEVIGEAMKANPKTRIQYAAKYASISNAWKKWQGEILGLERLDAVNKKLEFENEFRNRARANKTWESEYREVFANFDQLYAVYSEFIQASDYYSEVVLRGVEIFRLASRMNDIINNLENEQPERAEKQRKEMVEYLPGFFKYYTTLEGIMEKDNPEIYDYNVPDRLKELYETKDFGPYAADEGYLPVCFTASNHTTGGNSGSPVVNAEGHLVGVNFDRCWEGTMSDIMYDPEQSRNISIDIRYALFLIDKFAGAGYLLEEMDIVEN